MDRDKEGFRRVDVEVDDVSLSRIPLAFCKDRRSRNTCDARPAFTFVDFIQRQPRAGRMGKVALTRVLAQRFLSIIQFFPDIEPADLKRLLILIRKPACAEPRKSCPTLTGFITYNREDRWEIEIALETKEKRALL